MAECGTGDCGRDSHVRYLLCWLLAAPQLGRRPGCVDNAERNVRGYTEAYRRLFDAVWTERCALDNDSGLLFEAPIVPIPKPIHGVGRPRGRSPPPRGPRGCRPPGRRGAATRSSCSAV